MNTLYVAYEFSYNTLTIDDLYRLVDNDNPLLLSIHIVLHLKLIFYNFHVIVISNSLVLNMKSIYNTNISLSTKCTNVDFSHVRKKHKYIMHFDVREVW